MCYCVIVCTVKELLIVDCPPRDFLSEGPWLAAVTSLTKCSLTAVVMIRAGHMLSIQDMRIASGGAAP